MNTTLLVGVSDESRVFGMRHSSWDEVLDTKVGSILESVSVDGTRFRGEVLRKPTEVDSYINFHLYDKIHEEVSEWTFARVGKSSEFINKISATPIDMGDGIISVNQNPSRHSKYIEKVSRAKTFTNPFIRTILQQQSSKCSWEIELYNIYPQDSVAAQEYRADVARCKKIQEQQKEARSSITLSDVCRLFMYELIRHRTF